jgi:pSer/pThr/pTyr-binding forkhead associated (FHA) protein
MLDTVEYGYHKIRSIGSFWSLIEFKQQSRNGVRGIREMDVKLVFFKTNGQRKEFPLTGGVMLIGRGGDCDLRVPVADVSRRHCEIRVGSGGAVVNDLGSSNGTCVNNRRVIKSPLKAGDRLAVGSIVLTVQIDGVPERIEPVEAPKKVEAEPRTRDAEPVVDHEADVSGLDETPPDALAASAASASGEVDPIEVLEALAAENEPEEKQKK